MIVTFIPAAGQSSRMGGRDKLLETIHGEPILARTARIALEADLGPILVGLRPQDEERRKALSGFAVELVEVHRADTGMSATLRAGAEVALRKMRIAEKTRSGMMILLPDMPEISSEDLKDIGEVFRASSGPVVRATTQDGQPGHPTIIPHGLILRFRDLRQDEGASALIKHEQTKYIALSGNRARLDLDTPEDWAAWRKTTQTPR